MAIPIINVSILNGSNGFRLDRTAAYGRAGWPVSNAGDANGDGFDDVIIRDGRGISYVVFGKASGFDATLDLSSLDGSNGFHLNGSYNRSYAVDLVTHCVRNDKYEFVLLRRQR